MSKDIISLCDVLVSPKSIMDIYEKYRVGKDGIDYYKFLTEIYSKELRCAYGNPITSAGCTSLAPFRFLYCAKPLDFRRIRAGEPKYLLYEIVKREYKILDTPKKISFARPMDSWMKDWEEIL